MHNARPDPYLLLIVLVVGCATPDRSFTLNAVVPTPEQVAYQRLELVGFVHFTVNTFTDQEWGYGDESPDVFDPTALDTDQWASVAAEAGMKELILTAKHHDGFTLWPSELTEHSVAASPWRSGDGDLVREFVESNRRHGLKSGLYLSPWDRNHADYGSPAYLDYYRGQLRELLTNYGEITEVWFDGANGGDGYYGGAREERRIDRTTYYDWDSTMTLVKSLQPQSLIFSDAGPDIRWIGNEHGHAGETNWSTINARDVVIGGADPAYLNTGDADGADWVVPQCDVSIRPGWFYHASQDAEVKSPADLVDLYYKSIGRNCVLLLNIPPDRRGLFHEDDIRSLREFRRIIDATFADNLAAGTNVTADSRWSRPRSTGAANVVDGDLDTFWAAAADRRAAIIEIAFDEPVTFDIIQLQEPIRYGQRVSSFRVEAARGTGWEVIARATTIGYKRILQTDETTTDRIRIVIEESNNAPALNEVGVYLRNDE